MMDGHFYFALALVVVSAALCFIFRKKKEVGR